MVKQVFFDFNLSSINNLGSPDGMTTDSNNNLWVACAKGGKIICINPDGAIIYLINMPVEFITSCAFGGENLDKLYVVTSRLLPESNLKNQPQAGGVFEVDLSELNITGMKANFFIARN